MTSTNTPFGKTLAVLLLSATLFLSACDTAEERAEAHYQTGLAHLENGDVERALVEFKNVFKLNGQHKDARLTFARLERERGNAQIAYGQYLLLVEQYPDNLEGHQALAEMALDLGNWEELERHAGAALALAPDDIVIQSLNNTLAYTQAVTTGNEAEAEFTVHTAREMLNTNPDLITARQTVIDHLVRSEDWQGVVDETDTALTFAPKNGSLYAIRLRALQELSNPAEIEKQLTHMMQVFPGDTSVEQLLVEHHIDNGNLDAAEDILRARADPTAETTLSVQRLIAFLNDHRGADAAISELDAIVAASDVHAFQFQTMRAALKFRSGNVEEALTEMQALLENAERTTQTRQSEVEYARMLFVSGQDEAGRAVVEKVLAEDPTEVEAAKLKAAWLIEDDNTGDAILLLREALGEAPRDPHLATLMAKAHERNGDRELTGEMLALATELSQSAPAESLNYARYLLAGDDPTIAEGILVDALRRAPDNADLLIALGEVYLSQPDWDRLDIVLRTLRDMDDPQVLRQSKELRAHMLAGQKRTDELEAFLNELTRDPDFGLPAEVALIRLMLAQGDMTGATNHLEGLLSEDPDSLILLFMKASILTSEGQLDEAERLYREILETRPDVTRAWFALFELHSSRNDPTQAQAILREALAAQPENPDLLMLLATEYELAGDLDQAIAVYEQLYPLSNRSIVVANNLASLLSTHRSDDESLQRAQHLARRLRGTRDPAFQDTYGWIAYRLGNYEEAVTYLEASARVLSEHPLVLYHLGNAYAAVDRPEDALRVYKRAQAAGGPVNVSAELKAEVQRLSTANAAGQ
ncbi:tetratricopeptide repeat protein [Ruegeria sp. HKCCD4332]|uniref:tetratricopeptide repeat protein n=1 Tax=Ruegeria sp. HKCCD4332 TaxID=2683021 RepID=UPI0014913220|nr:tetratricopeptide repeat protein [Ruegeria sp. HKCCD4332]NOD78608.1 tetratricopeptide repeat protein [Ruegeria sp. HKCCD4332]